MYTHIVSYEKCNELEHVDTHFLLSLSTMSPLPWTVQNLINPIPNYKPNQVNFVCEFNVWDWIRKKTKPTLTNIATADNVRLMYFTSSILISLILQKHVS